MPEYREPTAEQVALLVDQARWITERYESNAEGFMSRAGLLLGLIGVEGAVIAPAATHVTYRAIALVLLLVPSALLLVVLRPSRTLYPSHLQLVDAVLGRRHPTWLVVEQNLKVLEPELSLASQLKREAELRAAWYRLALYGLIGVQPFIVAALAIGATR